MLNYEPPVSQILLEFSMPSRLKSPALVPILISLCSSNPLSTMLQLFIDIINPSLYSCVQLSRYQQFMSLGTNVQVTVILVEMPGPACHINGAFPPMGGS